jgi:hypothetical protein
VVQRGTDEHPGDIRFPLPDWWHEMVQQRREEVQGNKASPYDAGLGQEKVVHAAPTIVADPSL